MAKKKIYAVRKGRTTGLFQTWDDCKRQVDGFPGAQYKSFNTWKEAATYMEGDPGTKAACPEHFVPEYPYAFTDGSYNIQTGQAGWGGFLSVDDKTRHILQGTVTDPGWNAMRNVAGETCGAMDAIRKALELKLTTLHIYYDYSGVELWNVPKSNGGWAADKPETRFYQDAVASARAKGLEIVFQHVQAHTGIPGNEEADRLAKQAVGVVKGQPNKRSGWIEPCP